MTSAVVLAAGASTRLGELKQLARLGDETLLDRAVRVAKDAGCSPIVVVLGYDAWRMRETCDLSGTIVLLNRRYDEGMASSIQCGLKGIGEATGCSEATGCIVMTCDQPAVTAQHLQALMANGDLAASQYAGRRGVPAYFPASTFDELKKLTGDTGARALLQTARTVELPHGELDIDTTQDLEQARKLFE